MNDKKIYYQQFLNREQDVRHHRYDEEMRIHEQLATGDAKAIEKSMSMFTSKFVGHLSDDLVKQNKYLFIAAVTLITRFAISKGMEEEVAFITSDLYIQQMDKCEDVDSVLSLAREMFTFFSCKLSNLNKKCVFSHHIILCIDYIYYYLHEKITIEILAEHVGLNPTYLSDLFKKEMNQTISQYITSRRMEAAKNMLLYSDISYEEIASVLAFSSQSYFTKVFRKTYGLTPKEYKDRFFRTEYLEVGFPALINKKP